MRSRRVSNVSAGGDYEKFEGQRRKTAGILRSSILGTPLFNARPRSRVPNSDLCAGGKPPIGTDVHNSRDVNVAHCEFILTGRPEDGHAVI
jgi:hypothetical protein